MVRHSRVMCSTEGEDGTMRTILITGGAGFIGANLVRWWREQHPGDRLVILDALTYSGDLNNLDGLLNDPAVTFVHGAIQDTDAVAQLLRDHQVDSLLHLAAESHVDRSIAGPDAFIDTNIVGTHSLLKACRDVWQRDDGTWKPHHFHHVSTDEVFGSLEVGDAPFREGSPYAPNSPYSASKAASDHLVRAYHQTYGLHTVTTHCSNNYGPYQHAEKLIPYALHAILRGEPVGLYGDGLHIRDWMHVSDHCRGISLALTRGIAGSTYGLGGQHEATNLEVVHSLCDRVTEAFAEDGSLRARFPDCPAARGASNHELIAFVDDRPGHDRRYAINTERAATELGYAPRVDFTSGLAATVRWYLAKP